MEKITEITPEQSARFGEWARKWIETGLSTEPADFDKANAAALRAYKACNLDRPLVVLRMSSPFGATVGQAMAVLILAELKKRGEIDDSVWSQVWSQVGSQVWSQVWSQVRSQVRSQVGSQVRSQVWSLFEGWPLNEEGGALEWATPCSQIAFCRDVLGVDVPDEFSIMEDLAGSCGWVCWHENVLAISDRPEFLNRDDEGRLHSLDGPAVRYRDGWSVYAVNGVAVPADIVERPESITTDQIRGEDNAEVRRVMLDQYGVDRYLADIDAKPISRDDTGELFEIDGGELPIKIVKVINSTPEPDGSRNIYFLKGHSEARSAREAVASTFGLPASEYRPAVET